jgi:plastocyanin
MARMVKTAALFLALAAGPAGAASLQLTVTGADGKPAADTVVMVLAPGTPAPAAAPAAPVVVEQKDIRFVPYVAAVPLGASVRFVNRDVYDHHIRTLPGGPLGTVAPAKTFELRLAPARRPGDASEPIVLDTAGAILLGCHLHGSMRGHLYVAPTPFVAVTDARGQARIDGLPDAGVELRLWHPDQIVEQPSQRLALAGAASAQARLNFAPRPRPRAAAEPAYGPPGSRD